MTYLGPEGIRDRRHYHFCSPDCWLAAEGPSRRIAGLLGLDETVRDRVSLAERVAWGLPAWSAVHLHGTLAAMLSTGFFRRPPIGVYKGREEISPVKPARNSMNLAGCWNSTLAKSCTSESEPAHRSTDRALQRAPKSQITPKSSAELLELTCPSMIPGGQKRERIPSPLS